MVLELSHFFFPYIPLCPASPSRQHCPPQFMSMGRKCKFFGFSISYTILNLSLSVLYLQIMLLSPCTFPPILPRLLPADNPPCDFHFCDSVPVLVVCLVCFCFILSSVVDRCEFVVILMFIVLIFSEISPFHLSYKGLVMMNSFNWTLSGKQISFPSILNDSFVG